MASRLVCEGCGFELGLVEPYPFRCPHDGEGDVDHVLRRRLDLASTSFPRDASEPNPFLRYRRLLRSHHVALRHGLSDLDFQTIVRRLDYEIATVDGRGFRVTPFARSSELSDALGFSARGGVWVKDETGNVSGSHKARHLFGVLLHLEVAERAGLVGSGARPDLAIASCGNAALAAAVVAAAGARTLQVFVPTDADPVVLARLEELGAFVTVCPREGPPGDPAYHALVRALAEGALPFTCQGNLNGLTIEGGETLAWEIASSDVGIDRLVVQVGGGALASACIQALTEAFELGAIDRIPRLDTVQTEGAWPLKRAFEAVEARGDPDRALRYAATHRSQFMWPWEQAPSSIAHGILDDETYDWLAVVEGMLATGGRPAVASEDLLSRANALAQLTTGIDVDPTGSAGLAGLLALREAGEVSDEERVAVLFTGAVRSAPHERRKRDEKLPRKRHLVAEGLRAR
jgi:threonine synthase